MGHTRQEGGGGEVKVDLSRGGLATEAQLDYIYILIASLLEKGETVPFTDEEIEELTREEASEIIDDLKNELGWS